MDEIEDMTTFVEVVRGLSLSRAAESLNISKSMVSRRLSRLEEGFGARLLDRTTRGVRPTEAGIELLERAERILDEMREAREAVAALSGTVLGTLRITVPLSLGGGRMGRLLAEFAALYPQLALDVDFDDRVKDLIDNKYDAAIRIGQMPDSSFIIRQLMPVKAACLASPDYLRRHGTPREPRDLYAHECLRYLNSRTGEWDFLSEGKLIRVRPRGRMASGNGEALLEWAIHGYGVVNAPTFMAEEAMADGRLVQVLEDYPSPEFSMCVMRPPGGLVPAKVRALTDFLVGAFGDPDHDSCRKDLRPKEKSRG
jgi:DNA-binding transcriptional LysR family regulator